jgi:transposase-like protein
MATVENAKHSSEYWQAKITAWEQSGQTQKSFCEQHDLNYHRFGYWRRKYREAKPSDLGQSRGGFVAVQQRSDRITSGLILTLPNGIRIQGIESANLSAVCQLLRQL